ncbi:MAG: PspC domain-containing protein [Chitinophagaceae bacterium]|nr:PspC domain-containing protein [Chitinophagaceae bacterium]
MNKVININFQGRVIPIEEPAYEELKKYIDSLRAYFANEEGKEEIINDIENRIAELFSEKLKAGQSFISGAHVEAIIASMGRPEQFDELAFEEQKTETASSSEKEQSQQFKYDPSPKGSLFRNANDKMLGGVCSGIGAYLKIDTTLVRVLFAMLAFGAFGTGLVLYIILWAILPSKYLSPTAVTRKLYRDADQKVIGGVCSGIAQYFNIAVWIPRLIFALPLVVGLLKIPFTILFFPVAASFSGTMFIIYIILWIVVPKAVTASEKLEMKGQRVDLESIKHKVQDEMQGVKKNVTENASVWKKNIETKVDEWGKEVNESAKNFAGETGPVRKTGNKVLRFIVTLFKIFFLFVFGIIAISLVAATFGIGAAANALMPLKNFIADGNAIQWYAWGTLLLFILVPIIALVQWLIRAIIGHKSKSNAIGITFGALWTLGWVAVVMLGATVSKQLKRPGSVKEDVAIVQPSTGKLKIEFKEADGNYYPLDFDFDNDFDIRRDNDGIFLSRNEDSLLMSNIRVAIEKSPDSLFHVTLIKRARSSSPVQAEGYAELISYKVSQLDTVLQLPLSFPITTSTKFRNQQVLVEVKVPVGKEVYIDKRADELSWYSVRAGQRGLNINIDNDYEESNWRTGVWYIMQADGIERKNKDELSDDERLDKMMKKFEKEIEDNGIDIEEMDIKIKDGDTSINVNLNTFLPKPPTPPTSPDRPTIEEGVEEEIVFSSPSRSRRIFFGAMNLLKLGR